MTRKQASKFEECVFVGEGEEDIRNILKRQFIRYVNNEKGFPYLGMKGGYEEYKAKITKKA